MNAAFVLSLASLSVFIPACIGTSLRMVSNVRDETEPVAPWPLYVGISLPFLLMCFFPIPLPVFYLFTYVAGGVPTFFLHRNKNRGWLFINTRFLLFSAPHLVSLGAIALCSRSSVRSVLASPTLRTAGIAVSFALITALNLALHLCAHADLFRYVNWDSGEPRLFSCFLGFCSVFVLFDSVPCLFELPAGLAILFLIGSNVLLLMMAVLFAFRIYAIARNAYLKDEYLRLKEEEAVQRSRMVQLEKDAYIDALTNAYTRRYAIANMSAMLESGEGFVLAFLDLDRLKQVNDLHGHLAGDRYLRRFSSLLKSELRVSDVLARYGGDEFLILMPGCPLAEAAERVAQIRSRAEAGPSSGGPAIPFSYGMVQAAPGGGLDADELIAAADRAMYEDKKRRQAPMEGFE